MSSESGFDYQRAARNFRTIAYVGLAGDLVIAAVFVLLRPFGDDVDYYVAAFMVAAGVSFLTLFGRIFPKRYELRAQDPPELKTKE